MAKGITSEIHFKQNFGLFMVLVFASQIVLSLSTDHDETSEILVKRLKNSTGELVPKIFKLSQDGEEKEVSQPSFTLKSDIVNVQSDFKTVNINALNELKNKENAKKAAIVHQDLQSRIKPQVQHVESTKEAQPDPVDPAHLVEGDAKQIRAREDIKSRLFSTDEFPENREDDGNVKHHPSKRSEDDYYMDESETELQSKRTKTPPAKEEDSFFNIFESLFGSSDEESQTKKDSNSEEDILKFEDSDDPNMKENIKTVGDILKPLKSSENPESKSKNPHTVYQSDNPEYRIINNFNVRQSEKQGYQLPNLPPSYHSSYRPITELPLQTHKTHSTSGYEDYDLEEFMDKTDSEGQVKYIPSEKEVITTTPAPMTTPHNTNTTNANAFSKSWTTNKIMTENKIKFPNFQKNKDYITKNRYQEYKAETNEKHSEKENDKNSHQKQEMKTTTVKPLTITNTNNYNHISKINEIQSHKVQESPNFYNLINLPVKYSTKDTAIPLISTSYANTKIQGMGAHKYEKGNNGKYPNHKYDQPTIVTTQKPSYWATKRTESTIKYTDNILKTDKYSAAYGGSKLSSNYISKKDFDKVEYDPLQIGMGPEFGGYGSKKGVDVKTEIRLPAVSVDDETSSQINDNKKIEKKESHVMKLPADQKKVATKEEITKITPDDYDEEIIPARVEELQPPTQNHSPKETYTKNDHQNEVESNKDVKVNSKDTHLPVPDTELSEYEYYDYDFDLSTTALTTIKSTSSPTVTTTTTPASEVKNLRPNLPKDVMEAESVSEKVALVIATNDKKLFAEKISGSSKPPAIVFSSAETTVPPSNTIKTTITTTTTLKPTETTVSATKQNNGENILQFNSHSDELQKPNLIPKESLQAFEKEKPPQKQTNITPIIPTKIPYKNQQNRTESTTHPFSATSINKQKQGEQASNSNVVLIPTKVDIKATEKTKNYTKKETLTSSSPNNPVVHMSFTKPNPLNNPNYPSYQPYPSYTGHTGYTTEFTLGAAVHGHGGNGAFQVGVKPNVQGQFTASSVAANPYGNDQPFKPISKPVGMTSSFQVVRDDSPLQLLPNKTPVLFHNKHPVTLHPATTNPSDRTREPSHKFQDFVPSPQFHRPTGPKIVGDIRPTDNDYELEGIQTEPKPGQYVIFSKPQLNPELNENQVNKNSEFSFPKPSTSSASHLHQNTNAFSPENQEHIIFNPKEGQFYYSDSAKKPLLPEKSIHSSLPSNPEDELPLQLTPPRGIQTEKPFDRNFVTPESEKKSTVSYPRPHWEKNGKPSFYFNAMQNKNDLNRAQPATNQGPHALMPHNVLPQRYRRPVQPNLVPSRKHFNEAAASMKSKSNLPNILPQFRPNTKVGSGPYQRPTGLGNPNRRNGMNRYYENEHGNFPYHIQYPEKEGLPLRDYERGPEIVPKFITNRGKLPSDMWNNGMQKRFGQSLPNVHSPSGTSNSPQNLKVLKRLQRTPVTTLQMLKQMQGVKTQKMPITREDEVDASALVPPIYRTFTEHPSTEERLYVVYPAKPAQKLSPNYGKVIIVSDTENKKSSMPKSEDQQPVLNPNKRGNITSEKTKSNFPYGFVKFHKQPKDNENSYEKIENLNLKGNDDATVESVHEVFPEPVKEKHESIDMNLHMQGNNQWNEMKTTPLTSKSEFQTNMYEKLQQKKTVQTIPPSEYRTSIIDGGKGSAFTVGAIMHTSSDVNRKGQVASVPLLNENGPPSLPQLNVNERISNGKIITVSMPLDVKETQDTDTVPESQGFQAPFQASSSVDYSGPHSPNQGWTVVKRPENNIDEEKEYETTEISTTRFSFEKFKPELQGGFRPIFENLENMEELKQFEEQNEKKSKERDEKFLMTR